MGKTVIPYRFERALGGPMRDLARKALEQEPRGAAAFVFVIVDQGTEWAVDVGADSGALPFDQAEEFRAMLHATVDMLFDTAGKVGVGKVGVP